MRRKALIISNPGESGANNYCEGVNKDVKNYKQFLMSPQGGYWFEEEVICLNRPSIDTLKANLQQLSNIDYTLIVFCGHGYSFGDQTILELKSECEIPEKLLRNNYKKRTIILDCCRKQANNINESIIHEFAAAIEKRDIDGIEARRYYDEIISSCDNGIVVAYACDLNETAGDDSRNGGYYSYSLLQSATKWSEEFHYYKGYKSIVEMHQRASILTREKSEYQQNPQIEKPRSCPYFPFVVYV